MYSIYKKMALSSLHNLGNLFYAKSVAVVGASPNPRKASHQIIKTMVKQRYKGKIFPVHPSHEQIMGLKCYPSLGNIKNPIDLLIICVPAENTYPVFRDASERSDIQGAVVLSAGFAETAISEKIKLEKEIIALAKKAGIRLIGPNCIGLINTENNLCTGFAPGIKLKQGNMGILTQSGAFGGSFLMLAGDQPEPLGFSKFAHTGNASDVSMIEILDYLGSDPKTDVIAMYLEGVRQGRELFTLAKQITQKKSVFCLKVGKTDASSQAALSHTASLAGSDNVYDAAFKQGGVTRVEDIEELLDTCKAASLLPPPKGRRVCILTEAGGPGIIALDELGKKSFLTLASLSEKTKDRIKKILPPMAVVGRPEGYIDMTAAAMEREHSETLKLVLNDKGVDSVILISVPPTFLPAERVAVPVAEVTQEFHKPVAVCLMNGRAMQKARRHLEQSDIPTFDTPDRAARALENLSRSAAVLNMNNPYEKGSQ
jgi:acetyltransferase